MHDVILPISDLHFPYNHPDVVNFLQAIKKKYLDKAKRPAVVFLGDEIDWHSISFHEKNPELFTPGDELKTAINRMQPLYKMFPDAWVIESNHGSLVYRKQKFHGLPREVFKSYRDMLEAPRGWKWVPDLILKTNKGAPVYFHHGKSNDSTKLSQAMAMNAVQGHYHEKFKIEYWANPNGLFWGMNCGCLIDDSSLAYSYNKTNLKRPLIGTGIIIHGIPKLIPMVLNKKGRWTGFLP